LHDHPAYNTTFEHYTELMKEGKKA